MRTKNQNKWAPPYHVFRLSGVYSMILDSEMDQVLFFGTNTNVRKWINRYLSDASLIYYYKRAINTTGGAIQNVSFKNYSVYEHTERVQSEQEVKNIKREAESEQAAEEGA